MVRFLGHCGLKVCEILHLAQHKSKQHLFFFLKKKKKKNPKEGERPIPRSQRHTDSEPVDPVT